MNSIKIYRGTRNKDTLPVVMVEEIGLLKVSSRPLKLINKYGSDSFEWGYSGGGPSDLARSILLDMGFPEKEVDDMYHTFKEVFIAVADYEGFEISEDKIKAWWDFKRHSDDGQTGSHEAS